MKELSCLSRNIRETFALLPTMEELELRFPHSKGCGGSPLTTTSELTMVSMDDPRVGSVGVRSYFLRCDECHVQREYRAK